MVSLMTLPMGLLIQRVIGKNIGIRVYLTGKITSFLTLLLCQKPHKPNVWGKINKNEKYENNQENKSEWWETPRQRYKRANLCFNTSLHDPYMSA